jgi:sugar phosphate isomerase/epimerase
MRLGVVDDWIPGGFNAIDEAYARKIAEMGFTGIGAHFAGDPDTDEAKRECMRIRDLLAAHGVELVQLWGQYPCLIGPDEAQRREAVRICRGIVRLGAALGAHMACARPTSLNPRGQWWAHRDNYAPQTRARLVRGLSEIGEACEQHGIALALECHVTTTLDTPENVRAIIEETGSPWIRVTMDIVNFVSSIHDAYNTTPLINRSFDVLGPYMLAAHVKDVDVLDGHVVHIGEKLPGEGVFDFDTFFRRFEALLPDGYAFIEHLRDEAMVRQASTFVRGRLADLGIEIRRP